MIADIRTVMWKEWHEYFARGANRGRGGVVMIIVLLAASMIAPFRAGHIWLSVPLLVVLVDGFYLPLTITINVIADAFAGERERHTLETLLSTRLSDRAILFGKVAAAVAYAWVVGVLAAILGLIVANLASRTGSFTFYAPGTVIGIVVVAALIGVLVASLGCLVSLRAGTVRQAQQALGIGLAVVIIGSVFVVQIPTVQQFVGGVLAQGAATAALSVLAFLVVLDALLLLAALARFQRSRLILE